jgi:hypothetical protein
MRSAKISGVFVVPTMKLTSTDSRFRRTKIARTATTIQIAHWRQFRRCSSRGSGPCPAGLCVGLPSMARM